MTPEQRAALQAWIAEQGTTDTVKLCLAVNSPVITGTTTKTVTHLRDVTQTELAFVALATAFGIPLPIARDSLPALMQGIEASVKALPAGDARDDGMMNVMKIMSAWSGIGDTIYDPHIGQESWDEQVPETTYGPSVAQGILGRDVTPREIEGLV